MRIIIWKYRFKSIGILTWVPVIFWLVIFPLLYRLFLANAGIYLDVSYIKTFWTVEILNVLLCVFWQMYLFEPYLNKKTEDFFEHLTKGWKRRDSIELLVIYLLLVTISFTYIAFCSKSFIPFDAFVKDYVTLICETLFIQGLFFLLSFIIKNTLFSMIGIFLLLVLQEQVIPIMYAWIRFMNGSWYTYSEFYYIKYILGGIGFLFILSNGKRI